MGISVRQPRDKQTVAVQRLAESTAAQLTSTPLCDDKIIIDDGYVGLGYGQPTDGTLDAISLMARSGRYPS